MQFISVDPLIDRFRSSSFTDEDTGPYFFAYILMNSICWIFAYGEPNPWDIGTSIMSVIITIFGLLYLKRKNGGTFANTFFRKYFALGWVIGIRITLLFLPIATVVIIIIDYKSEALLDPIMAILLVSIEIIFYRWLGSLFERAQPETRLNQIPHTH